MQRRSGAASAQAHQVAVQRAAAGPQLQARGGVVGMRVNKMGFGTRVVHVCL